MHLVHDIVFSCIGTVYQPPYPSPPPEGNVVNNGVESKGVKGCQRRSQNQPSTDPLRPTFRT